MTLGKQQLRDLHLIKNCPKNLKRKLLKKISSRSVKAICECVLNTLNGNIPLSRYQKNALKKYKGPLRKIGNKKGSLFTKKKLIIQHGGFLNILIPAALSVLTGLINR